MDTSTVTELVTAATEAYHYSFAVTPDKFLESLPIMGKGMLGIFLVMGIIILTITLLNKFSNKETPSKKDK